MPQIEIQEYPHRNRDARRLGRMARAKCGQQQPVAGFSVPAAANREAAGGEVVALMVGISGSGAKKTRVLAQTAPSEIDLGFSSLRLGKSMWRRVSEWMQLHHPNLPGIVGPEPQVSAFADSYFPAWKRVFRQNTMQLDQLSLPRPCSGTMRLAEPRDADLIRDWLVDFFLGFLASNTSQVEEATQLARAKILEKQFWVWEVEGEVVSMAGVERPTRHGITVVLVYTPPQARGKGFASNLVAQITQLQLQNGKRFCCLHTDADNPTSNKIYKDLGYYEVGEGSMLRFELVCLTEKFEGDVFLGNSLSNSPNGFNGDCPRKCKRISYHAILIFDAIS
jgi:predicted GNAT family acetyltransferase